MQTDDWTDGKSAIITFQMKNKVRVSKNITNSHHVWSLDLLLDGKYEERDTLIKVRQYKGGSKESTLVTI